MELTARQIRIMVMAGKLDRSAFKAAFQTERIDDFALGRTQVRALNDPLPCEPSTRFTIRPKDEGKDIGFFDENGEIGNGYPEDYIIEWEGGWLRVYRYKD